MAVDTVKDPRIGAAYHLKRKSTTEIQLKRVNWEGSTLTTSFKQTDENSAKKLRNVINSCNETIQSPTEICPSPNLLQSHKSSEECATFLSNVDGEISNLAKASFLAEVFNTNQEVLPLPELKKKENDGKKMTSLEKRPTVLENYLMRMHELVRISVDETYVENECKKLLSIVIKKVSFLTEDGSSERRI